MKNNAINIYDADWRLVRRSYGTLEWVTTDLGFTSHTYQAYREERRVDYVGELTLEDGAVYRRTHEAGWTDAQGREVAAVRDWRGSLRATWTDTSTGNATGGGGTTAPFIPGASAGTKIYGNLTGYYPYGLPWADWQGSDRYLFSGKELEREHGLFTYDFHARPYDPGLCRFTQPDPMATSNPRVNSFAFCSADPINRIDPTGMTDYFNINGKHLYYDDDGYDVSAIVFGKKLKGESNEDYGKRMAQSEEYLIVSQVLLDNIDKAYLETKAKNNEQLFYILRDGSVYGYTSGEKDFVSSQRDKKVIEEGWSDVHSHPNIGNKIGKPNASEADIASSGIHINMVLGYKEEITRDSNTIGAGAVNSKIVQCVGFYNKDGDKKGSGMRYDNFKSTVKAINEEQDELNRQRQTAIEP